MDLMLLRAYQNQTALQCKYLLAAAQEIGVGLQHQNTEQVFFALQNLLTAAANISKVLWGGGGKRAAERKPIRDSIGIADDSPLRDPSMRNHFEHFDERLDRWLRESKRHNSIDLAIGPKHVVVGIDDIDCFRWFNPQTGEMYFWGDAFNIQAIIEEAQKFLPKLEAEARKPHWEPTPSAPEA